MTRHTRNPAQDLVAAVLVTVLTIAAVGLVLWSVFTGG